MRITSRISILALPFLLAFLPTEAWSQGAMSGIRAMGMGEAFTASGTGTGSLFHNPAGISAVMMYSLETSYLYHQASGLSVLHASVVDGKSNQSMGGGIGYSYTVSSSEASVPGFSGHDLYGALAAPLIPGWLIIGAAVHYLDYSQFDETVSDGVTFDIGTMLALGDYLTFGAAARNIREVENSGHGLEAAVGLGLNTRSLSLSGEVVLDFSGDEDLNRNIHVGFEYLTLGRIPIRIGYQSLGLQDDQVISAGLGWREVVFGLDALYRQSVKTSSDRLIGLAISLYL